MTSLFDPLQVGQIALANRVVMAPLTRNRAPGAIPNALMAQYYAQRASAGLILSEATSVTPMGVGYADTPGILLASRVSGLGRAMANILKEVPFDPPLRQVNVEAAPATPIPLHGGAARYFREQE